MELIDNQIIKIISPSILDKKVSFEDSMIELESHMNSEDVEDISFTFDIINSVFTDLTRILHEGGIIIRGTSFTPSAYFHSDNIITMQRYTQNGELVRSQSCSIENLLKSSTRNAPIFATKLGSIYIDNDEIYIMRNDAHSYLSIPNIIVKSGETVLKYSESNGLLICLPETHKKFSMSTRKTIAVISKDKQILKIPKERILTDIISQTFKDALSFHSCYLTDIKISSNDSNKSQSVFPILLRKLLMDFAKKNTTTEG